MSEQDNESTPAETGAGITDDQLPEDLQPGEDNPLAVPLDPDEVDRDLEMDATQQPEESEESEDSGKDGDPESSSRED